MWIQGGRPNPRVTAENVIRGRGGDDQIYGLDGYDTLSGGPGDVRLTAKRVTTSSGAATGTNT